MSAETAGADPERSAATDRSREAARDEDDGRVGAMGRFEFIALMGMSMGMVAFSVDAMLPALPHIAADLTLAHPNDRQLVVLVFVLGLSLSAMVFGLAADAFGRRRPFFVGLAIYAAGSALAAAAPSFEMMLLGRFLQGIGAGGPRVLAVAVIRDRFEGRKMARVLSFVMMIFVLAPLIAPVFGLLIAQAAGWRAIFAALFALSLAALAWVYWRLPETLAEANRQKLDGASLLGNLGFALGCREAMLYVLALGFLFSAFLSYISSVQQLVGEAYGLGDGFIFVFSGLALSIFAAAWMNAWLVERLGMRFLSLWSLRCVIGLAALAAGATFAAGMPPLWGFLLWSAPSFFFVGVLFGNLNALAMRPLGRVAGLGAALTHSLASLVAALFAVVISRFYDGTPLILQASFALFGIAALASASAAERMRPGADA